VASVCSPALWRPLGAAPSLFVPHVASCRRIVRIARRQRRAQYLAPPRPPQCNTGVKLSSVAWSAPSRLPPPRGLDPRLASIAAARASPRRQLCAHPDGKQRAKTEVGAAQVDHPRRRVQRHCAAHPPPPARRRRAVCVAEMKSGSRFGAGATTAASMLQVVQAMQAAAPHPGWQRPRCQAAAAARGVRLRVYPGVYPGEAAAHLQCAKVILIVQCALYVTGECLRLRVCAASRLPAPQDGRRCRLASAA
jgi:hypothetical protein